ncbi:MAG: fibronectin type III domain-containing protein, partial [Candidatus Omnitrophica bacterium]|nr:fibronectin type III domain-containing protein [Candidatus Omnitrophota bacterium]
MRLKAFTILEMLAVFSVVAIVMGIGIPKIKGIQEQGRISQVKNELKTLQSAVESYRMFSTPPEYPPSSTTVCASYLVGAAPQMISTPLYDPFAATPNTEYKYSRSTNKRFYSISSVGPDKTNATDPIADDGTVTSGGDDPALTNGEILDGSGGALTAPGAPTGVTATAGNAAASVTFTAPGSDGNSAITGYTVTSSPAGGTDSNAGTTALTHAMTGLTNGQAYTFTVKATNAVGTSAASSASNSVTPAGVPGAPTAVTATAGNTTASVTFTAPSSNGGGAMTYTVTGGGTDTNAGTSNLTHAITGLTNGQSYTFTVKATNSAGQGAGGTSNAVTPAGVPAAPTAVTATAGNATASVTFVAPSSNGGGAMTYTVTG